MRKSINDSIDQISELAKKNFEVLSKIESAQDKTSAQQ
jgi:hypothetical protein